MNNLTVFCLTLDPRHEKIIKELSYIPVGLGKNKFNNNFFSDKEGINISKKNSFYGEYTFHFWLWKNYLSEIKTEWVGFCQYRKFFINKKLDTKKITFDILKSSVIKKVEGNESDFQCILGEKFSVENYKISKILKNHFFEFLKNPKKLFNKKERNLKFHFDLFHGKGNLDLAIDLLDDENKKDFMKFMYERTSFNPHNMFICRTSILKEYYSIIFPWLEKCENIFGFQELNQYGLKRIYGFLAERFLSYWFMKNFKVKEFPIIVKDLSDYKNL